MKEIINGKTFYDLLEVTEDASLHDIRKAYEKAKEAYNPSSPALYSIFSQEEAQQLNRMIESAFSVLSHPEKRLEYDQKIFPKKGFISNLDKIVENVDLIEDSIPKTLGQTIFGTYEINPDFEEKIKNAENFNGEYLQKIRHYKNITLEQLSERSKISKTYILAIESHDFDSLPAKVFVRGFVIQIAKLLKLPEDYVATSFMKNFKESRQHLL